MILETSIRTLEELYDDFIKNYELGNFTEGLCEWNGDDALMGPRSFAHTFKKRAEELGYTFKEYKKRNRWFKQHGGQAGNRSVHRTPAGTLQRSW